jgi:tetratricopeptide (TPR) repeat protein
MLRAMSRAVAAENPQPETIGRRIRELRLQRGLRQADLAEGRLTKAFISQVESGHSRPSAESLEHIAGRLVVPLAFLLGTATLADREHYLLRAIRAAIDAKRLTSAEALIVEAQGAVTETHSRGILHRLEAELAVLRGDLDEARRVVLLSLKELDAERAQEEMARAVNLAGRVHGQQGNYAAALQFLNLAASIVERAPASPTLRAAIYANRGTMHMRLAQLDDALQDYGRSSDAASEAEDLYQLAVADMGLGEAARELGDFTQAIGHAERAVTLFERLNLQLLRAQLLHNLGHVHSDRGDAGSARTYQEQALELARTVGDPGTVGYALERLSVLDQQDGHALEALARAHEAVAAAKEADDLGLSALAHMAVAEAYTSLGRTDLADQSLAEACAAAEQGPVREQRQVWLRRGVLHRTRGQSDEAARCFERAANLVG